jgi:hypothetical protein
MIECEGELELNPIVLLLSAFISLGILETAQVHAAVHQFKIEKNSIEIDVPSDYQIAEEVLGVELAILGPIKSGRRPVLLVTMELESLSPIDLDQAEKSQDQYQTQKQDWAKKRNGLVKDFYSVQRLKSKSGDDFISIGSRYEILGEKFTEYSNYIRCNKRLIHVKELTPEDGLVEHIKILRSMVESVRCVQ